MALCAICCDLFGILWSRSGPDKYTHACDCWSSRLSGPENMLHFWMLLKAHKPRLRHYILPSHLRFSSVPRSLALAHS